MGPTHQGTGTWHGGEGYGLWPCEAVLCCTPSVAQLPSMSMINIAEWMSDYGKE